MKSTAKGSDLENVSMSASLLKCNQCNAPHIGPAEQIMFAQHVSNVSMGNGWSVPIWMKTFLNWAFLLNPGNFFAQSRQLTCRRGKAQRVSLEGKRGLDSAFSLHSIFSFILSSYFCFLVPFNILIPCYILISAFSLRSRFFSHFLIFAFSSRIKFFSFLISAFSISISFRSLSYKFLLASLHRIFPLYPSSVFPVLYPTSYIIEQRHLIYSRSEIWGL